MSLQSLPLIGPLFAKPPAMQQTPAPPTILQSSVQSAGESEQTAAAQAAGRASTILTSGQGVAAAPSIAQKMLLGGG
jgi:hypothetical protein